MTLPKPSRCICDQLFKVQDTCCEPSWHPICLAREAFQRAPFYWHAGKVVSRAEAVEIASKILTQSRFPLFWGLDHVGVRNQQLAIELCRKFKGVIDVRSGETGCAELASLSRTGAVKATMGEIVERTDLVLLIQSALWEQSPRLFQLLENSHRAKKMFWLGNQNGDPKLSDHLCVDSAQIGNVLNLGESMLSQTRYCLDRFAACWFESSLGPTIEHSIRSLVDELLKAKYVTVIYSNESIGDEYGWLSDQITTFVQRLNRYSKAVAMNVEVAANGVGANQTLTWNTGFPYAVDLSGTTPQSCLSEYTVANVLRRRETDCAVVFGGGPDCDLELGGSKIRFLWTQEASSELNAASADLVVGNLGIGGDEFLRFDDMPFTLSAYQSQEPLSEFLAEVASLA